MYKRIIAQLIAVFLLSTTQIRAAGPELSISLAGGQVTLSWADPNYWLQSSTTLRPASWINEAAAQVSGSASLTLPANQPAAFYRLVYGVPLPPPTRLALASLHDTNDFPFFELTWDDVPGVVSYNVYMALVPGVSSANYTNLPGGQVFTGITNIYLDLPDAPNSIFLPAPVQGLQYYFVVTAVTPAAPETADSNEATGIYGQGAEVIGQFYTELVLGGSAQNVNVPGVQVSLVNTTNAAFASSASSDLNGEFTLPHVPAGSYQLCWQAPGFISGCLTQFVAISNINVVLQPIKLSPSVNSSNGLVYGQVLLANGGQPLQHDVFFGVDANARVTLYDTNGAKIRAVIANGDGYYVMPGVPLVPSLRLTAQIENGTTSSNINTFLVGEANLLISNSPPRILSVSTSIGGQPVYRVAAGATVNVSVLATDPDGDPLVFRWYTSSGPVPLPPTSSITWTIPANAVGFQYLWVRVSDGKGGYDIARLTLTVNPYLVFSGHVTGTDLVLVPDGLGGYYTNAAPVSNALVQLNGVFTNTDGNGSFILETLETNEYDIAISHPDYLPLQKVWFNETPDQEYRLLKPSTFNDGDCVNNAPADTSVTNLAGVVVTVPPGALLNSAEEVHTNCFRVTIDFLDPCNPANSFPGGNYTAGGSIMEAYSLVEIAYWDFLGNRLHLAPSASVGLFVPIGRSCPQATNPPALLSFYTQFPIYGSNRWVSLTGGTLTTNVIDSTPVIGFRGNGQFSGLVALVDLKPAVDVWVLGDATLHVPFRVMIYKDTGGAAPGNLLQTVDVEYNTTQNREVVTTPNKDGQDGKLVKGLAGGKLWLNVLDLRQAPGAYYEQWAKGKAPVPDDRKTVVQTIKFDTADTTTVIAGLGVSPDPPKQKRIAQLKNFDVATVKGYWNSFLTRRDGDAAGAAVYYDTVDPNKKKRTFAAWQTENKWATTGIGKGDDAYAVYFNSADLGAGRRMGMKAYTEDDGKESVAYYVATYASLKKAETDALKNRQPGDAGSELKYIVCMEYSRDKNKDGKPEGQRYIKFFAYDPKGNIAGQVDDEDRHRPLYVPFVCINCHGGGSFDKDSPKGDVGGQFIAFDTANYTFSTDKPYTRDELEMVFTELNKKLKLSAPIMNAPKILDSLVDILVAGNKNYTTAPPGGWGANADLYNKVYAVSCRSCHANQGNKWTEAGDLFKNTRKFMPHAQRTFSIYWGSATADKMVGGAGANSQPQIHLDKAPAFEP